MSRGRLAAGLMVLSVAFGAAIAGAAEFRGATEKGQLVRLRTAPNDEIKAVGIDWRTDDCSRPRFRMRRTTTGFGPPFDRSRPGLLVDGGQYRVQHPDARVRYRAGIRARMVAEDRWRGTFKVKAWITLNDGSKMTCRLRRIGWHAESR